MGRRYSKEILDKAYDLIVNKGYSANKTSKELGIDNGTMRLRLKEKYNLNLLPDGKKKIDSNYFNNINNEHKAYWLGFLTADGHLSNKNSIELTLANKDVSHLEKFKSDIKSGHKICSRIVNLNGKEFKSNRIIFKDSKMADDLRRYGFNANKSYNAYIPFKYIECNLMKHYMRGLFDGDGSIYTIDGIKQSKFQISIVSRSDTMIENIYDVTKKYTGIELKYRLSRGLHELRIYKQDEIVLFLKWLYDDCTIFLDRKYTKFIAVLNRSHK